jgi:hypothetical protein
MRADGTCRTCGAPIRWAVHVATGNRLPLDVEAREDGNLGVVEWQEPSGRALAVPIVAVNPSPGSQATAYRYTSHFATCPQAAEHRRKR